MGQVVAGCAPVVTLGTEFHYDSAHSLPCVPSGHKCGRLHGHTYRLIVEVTAPVGADGFVIDFAEVKHTVEPFVEQLDHRFINDIIPNSTVENQLAWLWKGIRPRLPILSKLRLYEGLNNYGEYAG
jgi:6-pyruvoyltetrahydropterin/6-carboxytetrahydropterin synthase